MISLRKVNGILVIIMILMLLHHAVLSVLFFYGVIDYSPSFNVTGRRLFYPLVLHIVISSYLYIKDKMRDNRVYPKLITETAQQFITGIAIVVFVSLHILSNMFYPHHVYLGFYFNLMHFIIDAGLVSSIFMHLRISIPRLLMSFGFLDSKNSYVNFKEKLNIAVFILLAIVIVAEIKFYWVVL